MSDAAFLTFTRARAEQSGWHEFPDGHWIVKDQWLEVDGIDADAYEAWIGTVGGTVHEERLSHTAEMGHGRAALPDQVRVTFTVPAALIGQ